MSRLERAVETDAWCPDPWSELSSDTGASYKLCCVSQPLPYGIASVSPLEHWNSEPMRAVRRAMLAGDRAQLRRFCESCHVQEEGGTESRRQRRIREISENSRLRAALARALDATAASGDGTAPVEYFHRVDLRVAGNLCNLRCVMCSPQSSSSIGEELVRHGSRPASNRTLTLPLGDMEPSVRERFWRDLREVLPRAATLYFAGGEPFMSEAHFEVLDLALELDLGSRLRLWYSTNLTTLETPSGRQVLRYLARFGDVHLSVSIDGVREKNDYVRFGSRFDRVVANVKAVAAACPRVFVEPSTCVSIFNVLDLPEIHAYCKELAGRHVFSNVLTRPRYLRATLLPAELRALAVERLSRHGRLFDVPVRWLRGADAVTDPSDFAMFVEYVQRLDAMRGTRFATVFPEFAPYLRAPPTAAAPHGGG